MGGIDTPRKRMAAHALVRDEAGRALLVRPTYEPGWLLPGGAVEADESPRAACARELTEELGTTLPLGRLLCLEWHGSRPGLTEALMFVYDGGTVPASTPFHLPAHELTAARWVDPEHLDGLMPEALERRIRAALTALVTGTLSELEDERLR